MKDNIDYSEMPNVEASVPRVSLIIPFEAKMKKQPELFNLLSAPTDKIERDLRKVYPEERALPVIKKLRHLMEGISSVQEGKSIVIFVSPMVEKLYFVTATDHPQDYHHHVLVPSRFPTTELIY